MHKNLILHFLNVRFLPVWLYFSWHHFCPTINNFSHNTCEVKLRVFVTFIIIAVSVIHPQKMADAKETLKKKEIRIVVTDSGLGGLAVTALADSFIRKNRSYEKAELIFVNALPSKEFRYNDLPDEQSKAELFSSVLTSITKRYNPDLILIACNTLSVVYPKTAFAANPPVPVLGIVEFGVNAITETVKNSSAGINTAVLITGTQTTISSDIHKQKTIESLGDGYFIAAQALPELETEIQNDHTSPVVEGMIEMYLDESLIGIPDKTGKIVVGLCCSHYGYVEGMFRSVMEKQTGKEISMVNPNISMAAWVAPAAERSIQTNILIRVVSQVEITREEIKSLAPLLRKDSPVTAEALENYEFVKELFTVQGRN